MKKTLTYICIVCGLICLSGCSFFSTMSEEEIKAQTDLVLIKADSSLVIKPTVLGFGAGLKALLSDNQGVKTITFSSYLADESFQLNWQAKQRVETAESQQAQAEYYDKYGDTAIGEKVPLPPEPIYLEKDLLGTIIGSDLSQQNSLLLPEIWPEGEFVTNKNGVIFVSAKTYTSLLETKKAELKLGLSENIISKLKLYSYQAEVGLNNLKALITDQENESQASPYLLEAENDFGEYKLKLDGKTTYVQTIITHNWFGEFIILNNIENPLVLKVTPNPLATSSNFNAKALYGYQITDVNL